MNWWHRLRRKDYLEDRLDAEVRYHFDRQVADNLQSGRPRKPAARPVWSSAASTR